MCARYAACPSPRAAARSAAASYAPSPFELQPARLNEQLNDLMPGLSAKVFRTYNASVTLEKELVDMDVASGVR
ncbi:hypothetical protein EON66_03250, partial [archaeon]